MAEKVGIDSKLPHDDYKGLMELTTAMNSRFSDKREVQLISQSVLGMPMKGYSRSKNPRFRFLMLELLCILSVSLFPSWLPPRFAVMFSKPFPAFSCRLNAWATMMAGTWLMGECEVNDCEVDEGMGDGQNQGVLVKRCRFLEESGCASVCVNSCKIPTQKFFIENMGLPLTMTPDYDTFECQFSFGLNPSNKGEADAMNTPCLSRCPTSGGMRRWHSSSKTTLPTTGLKTTEDSVQVANAGESICPLM